MLRTFPECNLCVRMLIPVSFFFGPGLVVSQGVVVTKLEIVPILCLGPGLVKTGLSVELPYAFRSFYVIPLHFNASVRSQCVSFAFCCSSLSLPVPTQRVRCGILRMVGYRVAFN